MNTLSDFYNSSDFKDIAKTVDSGEPILIVANSYKQTESFYYAMWFKYYDKIEVFKYLFLNSQSKTSIRGKVHDFKPGTTRVEAARQSRNELNDFKQIVFILSKNLSLDNPFVKKLRQRRTFYVKTFTKIPFLNKLPEKLISIENSFFNKNLEHNINGDLLVFDTETNGIPMLKDFRCVKYDYVPNKDDLADELFTETGQECYDIKPYSRARLLSIGWIILDRKTLKIKNSSYYLVKNSKVRNSISAQIVNKISDQDRETQGITFVEIYERLKTDLEKCGYIVCHGTDFDINVLCNEIKESELSFDILKNKCICNTKQNLYKQFGQGLSDLVKISGEGSPHNALYDAKLCAELFRNRIKD